MVAELHLQVESAQVGSLVHNLFSHSEGESMEHTNASAEQNSERGISIPPVGIQTMPDEVVETPTEHQLQPEGRVPDLDLSLHTKGHWPSSKNVSQ